MARSKIKVEEMLVIRKPGFKFALALYSILCLIIIAPSAPASTQDGGAKPVEGEERNAQPENGSSSTKAGTPSVEDRLRALEQIIERQQREIQSLREVIEQGKPAMASARTPSVEPSAASSVEAAPSQTSGKSDTAAAEAQKKVDDLHRKFGSLRFSGDIRFRVEPFHNQGFDSPAEAPSRTRLRIRARLGLDGALGRNFDYGFRIATGTYTDPISTNQTLTDFFERKPFALERAFIRYDTKTDDVGVQLIAGKFEPTFRRTQMVWDDDVNVEGASEALYFKTKSSLRQVKLVAFQLPFNEVSGDKDAVLYGGQFQSDWQAGASVSANVNVAYYAWTHADQVVRGLGAAATQVNGGISNGAGVNGGQNGSLGTTNRIIRDVTGRPVGFLANFHLLDVLGNLTWQARSRMPVTFTFDFIRNMSSRIDDERTGYWAGVQVGQTREPGDWLVGYTYTRIEQDAVLVPFNFSDILSSNSRAHIPTFGYQVAQGVVLQWTGLFSQRVNKIFPLSPVNRYLNRMQFDVLYRF
jgi:hypothetical protein